MDRGELLFEYRPPRGHPMLYAGLVAFGAVFLMGSAENLLRDNRPLLYAVYLAPVAACALLVGLLWPSPTRIHRNGAAPSRILVVRALRLRPAFIPWSRLEAVYPCSYDVTGAFVSPFASSDGKVTQTGLALEEPMRGNRPGRVTQMRFTPTRFARNTRKSRGFREAHSVVEQVFRDAGRPLVPSARRIDDAERAAMEAEARKPFMPFFAIVALLASAAPVLLLLTRPLGVPVAYALPVALVAPTFVVLRSWRQSVRRNAILNDLSKSMEHERLRGLDAASNHEMHETHEPNGVFADGPEPEVAA